MEIQICFKTNDVVDSLFYDNDNFTQDEQDEIKEKLKKWITWGEYVTLSYDTEKDTLTVMK